MVSPHTADDSRHRSLERAAPGWIVTVLAVLMAAWEPVSFAWVAASALDRLVRYGIPALLLLGFRVVVTGVGIVGGRALWVQQPGALRLARAWLGLTAAATIATFVTPFFPSNRPPTTKTVTLLSVLAFDAAWFAYLTWSPRVRRAFPGG